MRAASVAVCMASLCLSTGSAPRRIQTVPREVMQRLTRGDAVAPSEYCFRTAAQFDAPQGSKYDWMNRALFIGVAERRPDMAVVHFCKVD